VDDAADVAAVAHVVVGGADALERVTPW